MKLFEIAIEYHKELNPKIWDGMVPKQDVHIKLGQIADAFIEYLDVPGLQVNDVVITGSGANYNWTQHSDIDLHLLVDKSRFESQCPEFTDDFFTDKKTLWNEHHQIKIYRHPVEIYVQDVKEQHIASGVFSIRTGQWIKNPQYSPPSYDSEDVTIKADQLKKEIDRLIDTLGDKKAVDKIKEKIRKYRKSGLERAGEFSTENLAFKELRNSGYLERLQKYAREAESAELSLE